MSRQMKRPPNVCNICGLPGYVEYQDRNKETGEIETKRHLVPCLGHLLVRPHLWNRHPDYAKFRRLHITQKAQSGAQNANK